MVKNKNVLEGFSEERSYSQAFAKKIGADASTKLPYKSGTQAKWEKEKGAVVVGTSAGLASSEELDAITKISLEGRGLDREGNNSGSNSGSQDSVRKKKSKKGDPYHSHSKNRACIGAITYGNQEGSGERRPTIERGGTNTISMEVSGVGARSVTEGQPMLSQTTKESIMQKKQRNKWESTHEETASKGSSSISSAPIETSRSRKIRHIKSNGSISGNHSSKYGDSSISPPRSRVQSNHSTTNKSTLTITDMDLSYSGRGSSPQELDTALLDSHVHANPDQAIKTALQNIASEDWSNKCEGMSMVMCVARYYPNNLQPQLHSVILAVQKEVLYIRLDYS